MALDKKEYRPGKKAKLDFVLTDLDTSDVKAAESWYAARPDYVARMVERRTHFQCGTHPCGKQSGP